MMISWDYCLFFVILLAIYAISLKITPLIYIQLKEMLQSRLSFDCE